MSYRTFKRLLGETSLERKCRFLFGGGLLLLITGSFYFYGKLTADLVYEQNVITGRLLVAPIIFEKHWKYFEGDPNFVKVIDTMAKDIKPVDLQDYRWALFKPSSDDPEKRPSDQDEYDALHELAQGKREVVKRLPLKGEYQYFGAVRASKSCITCHQVRDPNVAE